MDGGACRLQSMGLQRVGHDWSNLAAAAATYWRARTEASEPVQPIRGSLRDSVHIFPGDKSEEDTMAAPHRDQGWSVRYKMQHAMSVAAAVA